MRLVSVVAVLFIGALDLVGDEEVESYGIGANAWRTIANLKSITLAQVTWRRKGRKNFEDLKGRKIEQYPEDPRRFGWQLVS